MTCRLRFEGGTGSLILTQMTVGNEFTYSAMEPSSVIWNGEPYSNASIEFLTTVFLYSYERAGTPMLDNRIKYALYWSDYFS